MGRRGAEDCLRANGAKETNTDKTVRHRKHHSKTRGKRFIRGDRFYFVRGSKRLRFSGCHVLESTLVTLASVRRWCVEQPHCACVHLTSATFARERGRSHTRARAFLCV